MSIPELRRSQLITTFGAGAMVDLPDKSVIVAGLDFWRYPTADPQMVTEPRLAAKIRAALGREVKLRLPPSAAKGPDGRPVCGIDAFEFPRWFIAQERDDAADADGPAGWIVKRRLLHISALDKGKWIDPDGHKREVVPVRFVQVCPKGHVSDIGWKWFIHRGPSSCAGELHLEETGTSGHLSEVFGRCSCGARRPLADAFVAGRGALGKCFGERPWLGSQSREECDKEPRLMVRTASNAYFPEVLSAISIPDHFVSRYEIVSLWREKLEPHRADLAMLKVAISMTPSNDPIRGIDPGEVQQMLERLAAGAGAVALPSVKAAEFRALSESGERIGRDAPDSNFFARELPPAHWQSPLLAGVRRVLLVERLREVAAMIGFTRMEPITPRTDGDPGDLNLNVSRAALSLSADWVPAVENRGEGLFIEFDPAMIAAWLAQDAVKARGDLLIHGFERWRAAQEGSKRAFPGAPYLMLHTFSHLLLTALSLDCGYPASSLRERIYALPGEDNTPASGQYGILLFTGTSDAEGTLGGLVKAGREIARHARRAIEMASLCSNDPVCAGHDPDSPSGRPLHGAACHGCCLIAETSCEQHNEFLDRALVATTVGGSDCGFFDFAAARAAQ